MGAFTCGLKYREKHSIKEIESWLEENCMGDWKVSLAGIDDSQPGTIVNHLEIYFEKAEDKDRFKAGFPKG